ncbi:modulator of macroautophagy TMEM150B-like isoform X1 [Petromyzon marinus]|uniref:modulator of macroautophagy TMEM150B-like isoform X1 n=1 Tax=Petromyzon marinus TaxID=7757 RepID=UPI003F714384
MFWVIFPVFFWLFATGSIWLIYGLAVMNKHVVPEEEFPYISTCGTYPPQSCIFGQLLNFGALMVGSITVTRYRFLEEQGDRSWVNKISLAAGLISALGASLVGNFQMLNEINTHLVGAVLAFGVGTLYFWIQTALALRLHSARIGRGTARRSHGVLIIVTAFGSTASTVSAVLLLTFNFMGHKSEAAIFEWILAMVIFALFATFSFDFHEIRSSGLSVKLREPPARARMSLRETPNVSVITLSHVPPKPNA